MAGYLSVRTAGVDIDRRNALQMDLVTYFLTYLLSELYK